MLHYVSQQQDSERTALKLLVWGSILSLGFGRLPLILYLTVTVWALGRLALARRLLYYVLVVHSKKIGWLSAWNESSDDMSICVSEDNHSVSVLEHPKECFLRWIVQWMTVWN